MFFKFAFCALALLSIPAFANQHLDELLENSFAPKTSSRAPINWAQPPVACLEELAPSIPGRGCLNLSHVGDPLKDLPPNLSPEEQEYWNLNKRQLTYCRSIEIMKRETAHPGSFSSGAVELAWMQAMAVENREIKIAAIREASEKNQIPIQVLTGALFQESLFSELGIAEDGNNFSCGMGQINIVEWCHWAVKQKSLTALDCNQLKTTLVKPFYEIAKTRLNGLPEYRLRREHFKNIAYQDVVIDFPSAPEATQRMRYESVKAFIESCQDPRNGIAAKANELASIYQRFIPLGLKQKDQYKPDEKFGRDCKGGYDRAYPLQSGWLLAVGSYNAGPKAVDALAHYNHWSRAAMDDLHTFANFTPKEMIESFYWTGKYNPATDKIDVANFNGSTQNWQWFKSCVLQRHIARVIQHVTLPGTPNFVDSLEGRFPCAKSVFDENGKLLKSGVPEFRRKSSGVKEQR